jgi:hypothetical protein
MDRPVGAIEVDPIKWDVGGNPFHDLVHVFVLYDEVNCSSKSGTDRLAVSPAFMRRMLI